MLFGSFFIVPYYQKFELMKAVLHPISEILLSFIVSLCISIMLVTIKDYILDNILSVLDKKF